MIYKLSYLVLLALFTSCDSKLLKTNSPLVSVIKLNSAEELGDISEAKKYQDINKVYGNYAKELSISPEKYWIEVVKAKNQIGRDKKFTNQFKYYNYNVEEVIKGDKSQVIFTNKKKSGRDQSIIYDLQLVDSVWVVQKITYKAIY